MIKYYKIINEMSKQLNSWDIKLEVSKIECPIDRLHLSASSSIGSGGDVFTVVWYFHRVTKA